VILVVFDYIVPLCESRVRHHSSLVEVEGDEKGESSQVADDKNVWADEVRFTGHVRVGP
jgi:hypothetical protein